MSWLAGAIVNNPAANTVLIDTGPIPEGPQGLPTILVSSEAAAIVLFQLRNAADNATLKSHAIIVPVGTTYIQSPGNIEVGAGERVRCVLFAAIAGRMQVSFFN